MREFLSVMQEHEEPYIGLIDIAKKTGNGSTDHEFVFHYSLIVENGLISRKDLSHGTLNEMGASFTLDGTVSFGNLQIRLTQSGHDFALALKNREVLNKLKTELKDAPFKTVFDGSQKLLQHFFKKKLDQLMREEPNT